MKFKITWVLAALLAAGCDSASEPTGGPSGLTDAAALRGEPSTTQPSPQSSINDSAQQQLRVAQADAGAGPASERFELGRHYERLSPTQPTSSSPDVVEVAEIFWYGCPHCYSFEPYLETWQRSKAEYVKFIRIPAVWDPLVRLHARAFYTAQALGKGDEMHAAFFREIHENGNALDSEMKLTEFFGRFGVDAAAFKEAFDSLDVHMQLEEAEKHSRRYRIQSVPSVVINGKYTTNGTMAGGYDTLIELVDELAASERAGN